MLRYKLCVIIVLLGISYGEVKVDPLALVKQSSRDEIIVRMLTKEEEAYAM